MEDPDGFLNSSVWRKPCPNYVIDCAKVGYSNVPVGTYVWFWCSYDPHIKTVISYYLEKTEHDWAMSCDQYPLNANHTHTTHIYLDEFYERTKEIEDELEWFDREDNIRIYYARPDSETIDIESDNEVSIEIESEKNDL